MFDFLKILANLSKNVFIQTRAFISKEYHFLNIPETSYKLIITFTLSTNSITNNFHLKKCVNETEDLISKKYNPLNILDFNWDTK